MHNVFGAYPKLFNFSDFTNYCINLVAHLLIGNVNLDRYDNVVRNDRVIISIQRETKEQEEYADEFRQSADALLSFDFALRMYQSCSADMRPS